MWNCRPLDWHLKFGAFSDVLFHAITFRFEMWLFYSSTGLIDLSCVWGALHLIALDVVS